MQELLPLLHRKGLPAYIGNPMGVSSNDTSDFPNPVCAGGVRVATFFPTCCSGRRQLGQQGSQVACVVRVWIWRRLPQYTSRPDPPDLH